MDHFPAVAVLATDATPTGLLPACTAALEETSGLHTHVVTGTATIPPGARVLVLPGANRVLADELTTRTGLPTVTTEDTTAIAIAAALSTTLARAGRRPGASHVLIAGARTLPLLFPLIMLAEVGQVTKWEVADAAAFPLHRIAADADVVIDLVAATGGGPAVIRPDLDRDPLLALPGLVRALAKSPHRTPDIDVHQACALALVMATAPAETRPGRPDRALTDAVSAAAVAALRHAATTTPPRSPGTEPDQGGS
jgi:malate dehydrogenase (oxaloacetate-decarboxylating)